VMVWLQR